MNIPFQPLASNVAFPLNPAVGDTVVGNDGTVWEWDGIKWVPGGSTTILPPTPGPGEQGPPGPTGPAGPAGPAGPPGAGINVIGSLPDPGSLPNPGVNNGDAYIIGASLWVWNGSQWVQGPLGAPGATGPAGAAGPAGPTGPAGSPGTNGAAGPQGPEGPPGTGINVIGSLPDTGPPSTSGTNAGDAYSDPNGTLWVWGADGAWHGIPGLMGPVGPAGPTGPAGADGTNGAPGAQGPVGPPGAVGAQGPAGPAGPAGPQGPPGSGGGGGATPQDIANLQNQINSLSNSLTGVVNFMNQGVYTAAQVEQRIQDWGSAFYSSWNIAGIAAQANNIASYGVTNARWFGAQQSLQVYTAAQGWWTV